MALALPACSPSNNSSLNEKIDLGFLSNEVGLEFCGGSSLTKSNDVSISLRGRFDVFVIKFRNPKCLEDFYTSLKEQSSIYDPLDQKSNSGVIGYIEKNKLTYIVNRIDENSISLSIARD